MYKMDSRATTGSICGQGCQRKQPLCRWLVEFKCMCVHRFCMLGFRKGLLQHLNLSYCYKKKKISDISFRNIIRND